MRDPDRGTSMMQKRRPGDMTSEQRHRGKKVASTTNLSRAVAEYITRQERRRHPDGPFDRAGRWYPSEGEKRACCANIRSPSQTWPWSNVASLYDLDPRVLRRAIRRAKEQPTAPEYAAVAAQIMAEPVMLAIQAEYLLERSA